MPVRRLSSHTVLHLVLALGVMTMLAITPGYAQPTGRLHSPALDSPAPNPIDKLDPWVIDHTANGQMAEFLVVLTSQADFSAADRLPTKQAKGRYVYETLWSLAQSTQGPILTWLSEHHIPHRSYYIVNVMWVKANREAALAIAARAEVARLEGNPRIRGLPDQTLPPTALLERTAVQSKDAPDTIEPGVQYVNAPPVWAMGFTGQGIVVGGQDTGYQWDHPALKNQYRGWNGATANHDYNWHDSIHSGGGSCGANSPFPCDDYGHGTHTMGTAVGSDGGTNQIGVAPGAKWIGCRNMDQGNGTPTTYLECFEFFLAPYPVNGTPAQGDPSKAPDVTTNSWSCPTYEGCTAANILQSAIEAQRAAGIMTVVAATNSRPSCSTISDPPSFYAAAYTVGALNTGTDTIAPFSSQGPVTSDGSNRRKPDITAPGTNTRSSLPSNTYGNLSGTSMATPHVAGAVALLWSARPQLTNQISATEQVLDDAATHIPVNNVCSSNGWPNNVYGYGRIDVLAAVDMVPPVLLSGVVRDATTSTAIPQVLVQANSITHTFFTTTGLDGSYALKVLPGTYTVTVSAQNYNTATVSNINIPPDVTTTLNFTLTFQPRSGVILSPSLLTATGKIGQEVAYTLYFTNTGSLTDTFYASTNNNIWPVKASPLSATLSVQASSPLVVTVTVPITALDGLTDTVYVMLTNAHVTALSNLITAADIPYAIFLPLFLQ